VANARTINNGIHLFLALCLSAVVQGDANDDQDEDAEGDNDPEPE
jgi:hypothetical protein